MWQILKRKHSIDLLKVQCLKLKTQWMIWTAVNVQERICKVYQKKIFWIAAWKWKDGEKEKRHGEEARVKRGNMWSYNGWKKL